MKTNTHLRKADSGLASLNREEGVSAIAPSSLYNNKTEKQFFQIGVFAGIVIVWLIVLTIMVILK